MANIANRQHIILKKLEQILEYLSAMAFINIRKSVGPKTTRNISILL